MDEMKNQDGIQGGGVGGIGQLFEAQRTPILRTISSVVSYFSAISTYACDCFSGYSSVGKQSSSIVSLVYLSCNLTKSQQICFSTSSENCPDESGVEFACSEFVDLLVQPLKRISAKISKIASGISFFMLKTRAEKYFYMGEL